MSQQAPVSTAIEPFRIAVPQADIDDLKRRLEAVRWPDDLPGYGIDQAVVRELADHWKSE